MLYLNRRKFIKYTLGTAALGSMPISYQAQAFWPLFFLRFLFSRSAARMFLRSGRGIPSLTRVSATRASRLKSLQNYVRPTKMYSTAPLVSAGVEIGGFTALSPELFKIVVTNNTNTIWIIDDDKPEEFIVVGENKTDQPHSGSLVIAYNELGVTGKSTEYFDHGKISVDPYEKFAVKLQAPAKLGGMRLIDLHGQVIGVNENYLDFTPSDPIVIASKAEVAN